MDKKDIPDLHSQHREKSNFMFRLVHQLSDWPKRLENFFLTDDQVKLFIVFLFVFLLIHKVLVLIFIVLPHMSYLQEMNIVYESLSSPWGVIIRPTSAGVMKP